MPRELSLWDDSIFSTDIIDTQYVESIVFKKSFVIQIDSLRVYAFRNLRKVELQSTSLSFGLVDILEIFGLKDLECLVVSFKVLSSHYSVAALLYKNLTKYAKHVELVSQPRTKLYLYETQTAYQSLDERYFYKDWVSENSMKVICSSRQPLIMTNMKTQRSVTLKSTLKIEMFKRH